MTQRGTDCSLCTVTRHYVCLRSVRPAVETRQIAHIQMKVQSLSCVMQQRLFRRRASLNWTAKDGNRNCQNLDSAASNNSQDGRRRTPMLMTDAPSPVRLENWLKAPTQQCLPSKCCASHQTRPKNIRNRMLDQRVDRMRPRRRTTHSNAHPRL